MAIGDPLNRKRMAGLTSFADEDPFMRSVGRNSYATPSTSIGKASMKATSPVQYRRSLGDRLRSGLNATGRYLNSNQFSEGVANTMPYLSNLVGAFRQAPMPPTSTNETLIAPSLVRSDAARAQIDNATVASDRAAGRYLSGQAAGAVQAANLGTKLGAYSNVAMEEANQNAQIRNYVAAQNAQITGRNVERANNYQEQVLARNIAQQRASSENLANFADKAVQDNARRDMMKLDKEKFDILSRMYTSGVLERNTQGFTKPGTTDEQIEYDPSKIKSESKYNPFYWKRAFGGDLRPQAREYIRFRNLKPVYS